MWLETCLSSDVLVWSNERLISWLKKIGLAEYADNLHGTGVHGAVIALDDTFDCNTLAYALQIPSQNTQVTYACVYWFPKLFSMLKSSL